MTKNRAKSRWHSAENLKDSFRCISFALPRVCDYLMHCFREIPNDTLEFVRYQPWRQAIFANLLLLRLLNRWHPHSGNEFLYQGLNPPLNQRTSCSSLFCACCHFDRPQYDYEQIDKKTLSLTDFIVALIHFYALWNYIFSHAYMLNGGAPDIFHTPGKFILAARSLKI